MLDGKLIDNGIGLVAAGSEPRVGVSWRSILVGSLLVALVCGLTPYNDYVVNNTFMVGSYLPLVMVLSFFVLVVGINALLLRFLPARAFNTRELAVIMLMTLVACSIPSQGFLRAFLPTLVAPFQLGKANQPFWNAFLRLDLPAWLFPVQDIKDGRGSDIVNWFYDRVPPGQKMPYAAWVIPLLGWGIFIAGFWATLVAIAWIVREQWGVNERLPFPLAQIEYSLIEQPEPGHFVNALFRSRRFWIAGGGVFAIHSLAALHVYFPRFPEVSLKYDFTSLFSQEPWSYLSPPIKSSTIFFTFIGITYFIPARTAFSLWFIFFLLQLVSVEQRWVMQTEITTLAWRDQHLGSALVYVAGMLWVGRGYWTRRRAALFVLAGGIVTMIMWLILLKVSWWVAALIVLFLLLPHVVTARIVAETGMPFIRSVTTVMQVLTNVSPKAMSGRDIFFAGVWTANGAYQSRESLLTFCLHGLRTCDLADVGQRRRERSMLAGVIVWTLVLGMFIGTWSSLHCYYTYATPLAQSRDTELAMINPHGAITTPNAEIVEPLRQHADQKFAPKTHNPYAHFGIGLVVTALLQLAAWRFGWWPLVPVGYVVATAQLIQTAWFSLMLGWLAKVLILRFGGARLFQRCRPVFIGIIFGEALAAGFWMLISLGLAWAGAGYEPIRLLPA
ncbi:MAG TPA: DUF6785 family protein [Tepidisphaeraceae bacterium]